MASKWLRMAENGLQRVDMAPNFGKWLETAGKCLKIAANGCKLLEMA